MAKALRINSRDNVAVMLANVKPGEEIVVQGEEEEFRLIAREAIPFGHKVALTDLSEDQPIIKYGEEIGRARQDIKLGSWVHLHNVYCTRGKGCHRTQGRSGA